MSSAATASWRSLGTSAAVVVVDPGGLEQARRAVERELAEIDAACSRFRDDSELVRLNAAAGRPTRTSRLLFEAIEVALDAARSTAGAVDPTIGAALERAGYDRDIAEVAPDGPALTPVRAPGWRTVELDPDTRTVTFPGEVRLDLGATAKALAADRAAAAAHSAAGTGVLVSLGGDIAVAGEPPGGGWAVALADDHAAPASGPVVAIESGGLATSSTTVRRWRRGGHDVHHILDPRTGASCRVVWRTATVAAATCVAANTASTA
ncbi:MAG: FAD:protein transferase, partial [Solirubrobacteraceae bacterium]|nr:FAD:protein transferase [Solirubrobacteraceae bacterium]